MRQALSAIAAVGFAGPVALAVLALTLLGAIALVIATIAVKRDTGGPVLRFLAWVEGALFAGSIGLGLGLVTAARRTLLAIEQRHAPQPDLTELSAYAQAFGQVESTFLLGGLALAATTVLFALAALIELGRARAARGRAGVLGSIALAGSSLLAAVTARSLARHAFSLLDKQCWGPRILCLEIAVDDAHAPIGPARFVVLGIAAVVTLILMAVAVAPRPAVEPEPAGGRGARIAAALAFAAGLAGFAVTRADASDAAHPVPVQARLGTSCPMGPELDARSLPEASSCPSGAQAYSPGGPVLEVSDAGVWIDGAPIDPALAEVVLRKKRELHDSVGPQQLLLVAVAAGVRVADVAPYLRVARAVFGPEILIVLGLPRGVWPTRTFGDLPLSPHCCLRMIRLGAGPPATSYATWGELAAAAALREDAILSVTP